ncbi:MAG: DUF4434 domain-containing protein [Candidatus Borkfalkiaceae bacterium]|nr:DUF4434 domain-containing protein [Christensenellaceae bacterium]
MNNYPISGTFIDEITYDIPSSNWTKEQWAEDLDNMKEVGIDTIIFIRGWFDDKCIYPSEKFPTLKSEDDDFAGFILQESAKRKMKVYIGGYISNLSWNNGDYATEIKKNKEFVKEVVMHYGDYPSFVGWYLPHEGNDRSLNLKETMGGLAALYKDICPDKKVLVSPFFKTLLTSNIAFSPEQMAEEWDYIWGKCGKDIDYCAFQDGTAPLAELYEYFTAIKKVCDKHKIELWSNVETFERDVRRMYYPIPFDLLRKKIEIVKPVVKKMITFEFSHFLSPQSIYPSARNLNVLYKNYYK